MTTYKARVYIDGLNFYHSIVKKMQNKEISSYPDLWKLCEKKLSSFPTQKHKMINVEEKIYLDEIHYFTALVYGTDEDLEKRRRQKRYNEALENENVKVTRGEHKRDPETGKLKEKQSDVNLATRFVYDVCNKKCNYAVIISNDTDFCGVIEFVLEKYPEMVVDVWTVGARSTPQSLRDVASICNTIHHPKDFKDIPSIANYSFDMRSVKNMP